jgi:AraC-like DNA-binding protein
MCERLGPMDVLTDLLQRSRAHGAAFSRSTVHGRWGVEFPYSGGIAIHAIIDGEMYAWTDDPARAQRVSGGDIVLVRADRPNHLAHAPGAPCVTWSELQAAAEPLGGSTRRIAVGAPDSGPAAVFCCGAYRFEGDLCAPLLGALPPLLRLRPAATSALRVTIDLLVAELSGDGPGQQALLDRLLDVAFVQALREHFLTAESDTAPGWLRALADPALTGVLGAIHDDPAHPWTVAELAATAALSRAAFARRFADVVGTPPLQYVTDWRMALAKERLRDSPDGLAAIATAVGYTSEFAFAAAFKRTTGTSPGRWRTTARAAAEPVPA